VGGVSGTANTGSVNGDTEGRFDLVARPCSDPGRERQDLAEAANASTSRCSDQANLREVREVTLTIGEAPAKRVACPR